MIRIPQDAATRERMLTAMRRCAEMMKGVAGFSVVETERPGSAIHPHGGILEDPELDRVLKRMRAQPASAFGGKLVILCTKPGKEWRIARLAPHGQPPTLADDRVFDNPTQAQYEIFRMRFEQYPASDGMPEHYTASWKQGHGENWS
jgi:hypothetical protein